MVGLDPLEFIAAKPRHGGNIAIIPAVRAKNANRKDRKCKCKTKIIIIQPSSKKWDPRQKKGRPKMVQISPAPITGKSLITKSEKKKTTRRKMQNGPDCGKKKR